MVTRLRASVRHGGAVRCFFEISVVDPPRWRPVGAAAHIIIGGMGVSTPIILSERFDFHRILFGYLTLRRLRPAAGARRFVIVLHYQFFLKKNRTFQYTSERGIACAPAPTRAGLAHRG
jgi:hypothetical protein